MQEFTLEYFEALLIVPIYILCLIFCKEKINALYFPKLEYFGLKSKFFNYIAIFKHLAILFLALTLSSPVIIDKFDPKNRVGIDIVLAIDVSGSMNESGFDRENEDASRFEAIKDVAKEFVLNRAEDNFGLVLFGDFAFINAPLTYEKDVIVELIDFCSLGVAGQSTALGDGIAMALRVLEKSKAKSKIVILLTDGRDNAGKTLPTQSATLAQHRGVKIYTIGIGEQKSYNADMLKYIAKESGGEFFSASDKHILKKVYSYIDELEKSSLRSRDYLKKEYLFIYPLSLAILFLTLFIYFRFRSLN